MPHLDIINLSADYAHLKVLSGISLTVEKGEVVCLVGPSGSGKSTLLRVLMGLTLPTAGAVKVDGQEIDYRSKASVKAARDRMALDGKALPGVPPAGAGVSIAKLLLAQDGVRAVAGEFNGERVVGRSWPTAENRAVVLELTY